ncbi:MAG: 4Fe-4S dicluster domain-containing protein [Ignavibacteria bacterium]|nr:4Fe-4S dicluster domain-containing protein [Ignavibacteria bacterium]
MSYALLIDLTGCVGCGECQRACQRSHGFPEVEAKNLNDKNFTCLDQHGDVFVRRMCQHCEQPACASVCPVGALEKTKAGAVNYSADKCIGCRYCMLACPYDIPKYEWASNNPRVRKCTMCYDERTSKGQPTACSEACPVGATLFGKRDELLAEAHKRIGENPDKYVHRIYGEKEAGGASVLYLTSVPFEKLGFKTTLGNEALPEKTWNVLSKLPDVVATAGVLFSAVYWITHRRDEVRAFEQKMNGKSNVN